MKQQVVTVAVNRMPEQQRDEKESLLTPYLVSLQVVWVSCTRWTGTTFACCQITGFIYSNFAIVFLTYFFFLFDAWSFFKQQKPNSTNTE